MPDVFASKKGITIIDNPENDNFSSVYLDHYD